MKEKINEGLVVIPIGDVRLDPANVRTHNEHNLEAIKGSLKRFGQQKPIVIDRDGVVIAGNGTLEAAKSLGWERIGVVYSNLSGSDRTGYSIADNRTAELAAWDMDALSSQLNAVRMDEDFDLLATGFNEDELNKMLGDANEVEDRQHKAEIPESQFGVLVECETEDQQSEIYERMQREGYTCRLLTL